MSGYIGYRKVPTATNGSGVWKIGEHAKFKKDGIWPVGDIYWDYVSLLLHGSGTNGSTTFIDSSKNAFALTRSGGAQISTAQYKFEGSSIYFDGVGDSVRAPTDSLLALGSGDFTIEFWVRPGSQVGTYNTVIGGGSSGAFLLNLYGSGTPTKITINAYGAANVYDENYSFQQDVWKLITVSRSGTNLRVFVDGVQLGATVTNSTNFSQPSYVIGGIAEDTQNYKGYLDELRITKGIARYTGNFTPPTDPFSS